MRNLVPEILDSLDSSDPEAIRSRKDLSMINGLMGNDRWIKKTLAKQIDQLDNVIEIGAGDGRLLKELSKIHPNISFTGVDLVGEPKERPRNMSWKQTDIFDILSANIIKPNTLIIANLILHHFTDDQVEELQQFFKPAAAAIIVEPHRSRVAQILAYSLFPIVNKVTKHDMIVSIKAGFRLNELPHKIGSNFEAKEYTTLFGGLRLTLLKK